MLSRYSLIVWILTSGMLVACSGNSGNSGGSGGLVDHPSLKVKSGPELSAAQKVQIQESIAFVDKMNDQSVAIDEALPTPDASMEEKKKQKAKFSESADIVKKLYAVIANQDGSGRCQLQLPLKQEQESGTMGEAGSAFTISNRSSISGSECPLKFSKTSYSNQLITKVDKSIPLMEGSLNGDESMSYEMNDSEFSSHFPITKSESNNSYQMKMIRNTSGTKINVKANGSALATGPNLKLKMLLTSESVSIKDDGEQNGYDEFVTNFEFEINGLSYIISFVSNHTVTNGQTNSSVKSYLNGQETALEEAKKYIPGDSDLGF